MKKARKQYLKARWQRAINIKERGGPLGLCNYMLDYGHWGPDPDTVGEAERLRELFDDTRLASEWSYLWSNPLWDHDEVDPDETARIIAAVIMRETVT